MRTAAWWSNRAVNTNGARAGVHTHTASTQTYSVNERQGRNYGLFHTAESKDTFPLGDVPKLVIICSNVKKGRMERDKNSGAE